MVECEYNFFESIDCGRYVLLNFGFLCVENLVIVCIYVYCICICLY